jgi:hypothetical protein
VHVKACLPARWQVSLGEVAGSWAAVAAMTQTYNAATPTEACGRSPASAPELAAPDGTRQPEVASSLSAVSNVTSWLSAIAGG